MTCRLTILLLALAAALVGGCAGVPAAGEGAALSRPLADAAPATDAERRARTHVDLGLAYAELGRHDVALDEAAVALAELPDYAPAHHLKGLVYMLLGEQALARPNLELALRQAPGDPDFNNSYGWFLCSQGQEREGLERLALAARNPYYRYPARPLTNAGLCHLRLNDDAAAEVQFVRALQADPRNSEAMYRLAEIAYRRGDLESARSQLVRLHQQLGFTAASVWLGLRTERRLGNREAEASYATQLRSRFAGSPEFEQMTQGKYE